MMKPISLARMFVLSVAGVVSLAAFRPASDTVGPLTVKMEGPAQITRTGVSGKAHRHSGEFRRRALKGTVRVQAIDRWTVQPAGPCAFQRGRRKPAATRVRVTAADPTYNAFYPIHAFAEFESQGRSPESPSGIGHPGSPGQSYRARIFLRT